MIKFEELKIGDKIRRNKSEQEAYRKILAIGSGFILYEYHNDNITFINFNELEFMKPEEWDYCCRKDGEIYDQI